MQRNECPRRLRSTMDTREQAVRLRSLDSTAVCGKPHVRWCGRADGRNPVSSTRSRFVLLSSAPKQLREWRERIEAYLREKLALELNTGRERLRSVSDGIDFRGYIVRRDYLLVRRRVVNNLKLKLKAFEAELVRNGPRVRRCRFDRKRLDLLFATLNSYLGHTQMAGTASLWRALWERHAWLAAYFTFDPEERKINRRYLPPTQANRASQQYRHYCRQFPEARGAAPAGEVLRILRAGRRGAGRGARPRADATEQARRALRISGGRAAGVSAAAARAGASRHGDRGGGPIFHRGQGARAGVQVRRIDDRADRNTSARMRMAETARPTAMKQPRTSAHHRIPVGQPINQRCCITRSNLMVESTARSKGAHRARGFVFVRHPLLRLERRSSQWVKSRASHTAGMSRRTNRPFIGNRQYRVIQASWRSRVRALARKTHRSPVRFRISFNR